MSSYKEKIQRELRKALENFKNGQNRSKKTHPIQKQTKHKRLFRPHPSFYQEVSAGHSIPHVLNFFNILSVNENTLRDKNCPESFIQTNFFYKTIRKIEEKQNYIVLFLNDSDYSAQLVQEALMRYQSDSCSTIREIGEKLSELAKKLQINPMSKDSDICLTSDTYEMLDRLGQVPFVCKIFSQKLAISKSLLTLMEFSTQQFIVQSLKCKFPAIQFLSSKSYEGLLRKEIQFYSGLMYVLQGSIPFASFSQFASYNFVETVTSKSNMNYLCQMSFSMPIPLIELITIEQIYESHQKYGQNSKNIQDERLVPFLSTIRNKQHAVLRHLLPLHQNYLPEYSHKVASYAYLPCQKSEDEEKKSEKSDADKSNLTFFEN